MAETYFDTRLGELLIGEVAIEQRLEGSGPGDIVPLQELILAKDFPFQRGDFETIYPSDWSRDEYVQAGKWALELIRTDEQQPRQLTSNIVTRLAILGLMPDKYAIQTRFKTFSNYKLEIGSPLGYDRVQYRDWDYERIIDYIYEVRATLPWGQIVPLKTDYDQRFATNRGPSYTYLRSRLGGVGRANELLGHYNVREWEEYDFINYGLGVVTANGDWALTVQSIDTLAGEKKGPWRQAFIRTFGTWSSFKETVLQAKHDREAEQEAKIAKYRSRIEAGTLPGSFRSFSDARLTRSAAIYDLLTACRYSGDDKKKIQISQMSNREVIARILSNRPRLDAGTIETEALILGVFDDIWPAEVKDLKIPPAALHRRRQRTNKNERRYKRQRKKRLTPRSSIHKD